MKLFLGPHSYSGLYTGLWRTVQVPENIVVYTRDYEEQSRSLKNNNFGNFKETVAVISWKLTIYKINDILVFSSKFDNLKLQEFIADVCSRDNQGKVRKIIFF